MKEKIIRFIPWLDEYKKIEVLFRKAHKCFEKGHKQLALYYAFLIKKRYHCIISPSSEIGKNICFPHPLGIVIGSGVIIKDNVTIYQNVTLGRKSKIVDEYPIIGNNVTIYCNAVIVGNIKIEDDAIIGCNSVVLRDVKKGEVVAGIVK